MHKKRNRKAENKASVEKLSAAQKRKNKDFTEDNAKKRNRKAENKTPVVIAQNQEASVVQLNASLTTPPDNDFSSKTSSRPLFIIKKNRPTSKCSKYYLAWGPSMSEPTSHSWEMESWFQNPNRPQRNQLLLDFQKNTQLQK